MVPRAARVKMPTSVTSPDYRGDLHGGTPVGAAQKGFTLIELLVVLAIAGLLVALVPTAYSKAKESSQYRSVLRTLAADMRFGRQSAMARGSPVVLSVDLAKRQYGLEGYGTHILPEPLQIRATVGGEQLQADQKASIIFLPDGGSTGGSFEIVRPGGDGIRLRVDWLSGQVSQEHLLQ